VTCFRRTSSGWAPHSRQRGGWAAAFAHPESTHFLTKTLSHVSTEMSLHMLAYNLKRVISILGIARTMKAVRLVGA